MQTFVQAGPRHQDQPEDRRSAISWVGHADQLGQGIVVQLVGVINDEDRDDVMLIRLGEAKDRFADSLNQILVEPPGVSQIGDSMIYQPVIDDFFNQARFPDTRFAKHKHDIGRTIDRKFKLFDRAPMRHGPNEFRY